MNSHSSLAPQPAAANLTDPGAEKTLMLSELGLTGELLGVGQYGYTLKVSLRAPPTVAPIAEAPAHGTLSLFLGTPFHVPASFCFVDHRYKSATGLAWLLVWQKLHLCGQAAFNCYIYVVWCCCGAQSKERTVQRDAADDAKPTPPCRVRAILQHSRCICPLHRISEALTPCLGCLQGRSREGEHMAVKVYDLQQRGAAAAYETEKLAYQKLEALQGKTIPHFLGSGLLLHTAAPVIVISLEGVALAEGKRVPQKLHKPMRDALQALHDAGAAHGDVRPSNFLVSGREVRLVDLGQAVLRASPEQKDADMQDLKAMLPF